MKKHDPDLEHLWAVYNDPIFDSYGFANALDSLLKRLEIEEGPLIDPVQHIADYVKACYIRDSGGFSEFSENQ